MDTNLKFDAIKFITTTLKDMRGDVKYAYPSSIYGNFDASRGHTALQMISSKLETLGNFLDALSQDTDVKAGGTE